MRPEDYAIPIEPLGRAEGGGFLVTVADLPICMADGETVERAIAEVHTAARSCSVFPKPTPAWTARAAAEGLRARTSTRQRQKRRPRDGVVAGAYLE